MAFADRNSIDAFVDLAATRIVVDNVVIRHAPLVPVGFQNMMNLHNVPEFTSIDHDP